MLSYLNFFDFGLKNDSSLFIIYLNVYIYVFLVCQLFLIIFMFDTTYFRSITELKFIGDLKKITSSLLSTLLSMAGVPPLLGFCGKFIIFIIIFEKINLVFVILYSVFNLFVIFFYIQNFRFLSSNKSYLDFYKLPIFSKKNFFFDTLTVFQFLNFFSIFYLGDLLIVFENVLIFNNN